MLKNQRAYTVDPDKMAHYEPSHLDLQCLQIQLLLCLSLYMSISGINKLSCLSYQTFVNHVL